MNVDLAEQLFNQLSSSLENLETQHAALMQFLKDNGILTDDQFAPYLAQTEKASSVRWRATRLRLESVFRAERQKEEKFEENHEREAKTKNDIGGANAAPRSEGPRVNGAVEGTGEESISEKDDKQDEHAPSEDKKTSQASKLT
jgi:hypothetical protein